jgi:hypothetical protein
MEQIIPISVWSSGIRLYVKEDIRKPYSNDMNNKEQYVAAIDIGTT